MHISIRLAQLVKPHLKERGFVAEMARETKVERHTIRALLDNKASYVNLESLAKICRYLIDRGLVEDPDSLPGAILGRDPEHFWELMTRCERLEFCIGTRRAAEWPGSRYVISTDSKLQGIMMSTISQMAGRSIPEDKEAPTDQSPNDQPSQTGLRHQCFSAFYLVHAPSREATAENPGEDWDRVVKTSQEVYDNLEKHGRSCALLALGSIKVNPVVERLLARIPESAPFQPELPARAADRRCPIFFRYRPGDPQPPSFCGGIRLADDTSSDLPGIYYEQSDRSWHNALWDDDSYDAAFLCYVHRPNLGLVEVACGGFSSRATGLLTDQLDSIASHLRAPERVADNLHVGMSVVSFKYQPRAGGTGNWRAAVHEVPTEALRRRLS